MTRVVFVSDLHENLPEIPECDVLCVAGDITFSFKGDIASQQGFIINEFAEWLKKVPADDVVVVAGNHDQCIEKWGWPWPTSDQPRKNVYYLQDNSVIVRGLKIWGTPWQPWFYSWGFNAPKQNGEEFLKEKFDRITYDTDIIICHGPPYGYGDQTQRGEHVGSRALLEAMKRVDPQVLACGHIHPGRGMYSVPDLRGVVINASIVNEQYKPVHAPVVLDLV